MMDKLKKLYLYAGLDKEEFSNIEDDITLSNRKLLIGISLVVLAAMAVMTVFSFFVDSLVKNRLLYILSTITMFVIFVLGHIENKNITYILVYVFMGILFGFGIDLGTFIDPNEVTVSFVVLLLAVPLVFCDKPYRTDLFILLGLCAYLICARITQSDLIFGYNCTNVIPYCIVSIIISNYMTRIKVQRYALAYQNKHLSQCDQLTGLLNRRMFDEKLKEIDGKDGYIICAFDIDGLKKVNDSIGHHAGDELIVGASKCISEVFGEYGECYRTGGDEFFAIMQINNPDVIHLMKELEERCKDWQGDLTSGMSISCGSALSSSVRSSNEMVIEADKKMYASKAEFYTKSGNDRRRG